MSELRRQEVAQEDGPKGHLPRAEARVETVGCEASCGEGHTATWKRGEHWRVWERVLTAQESGTWDDREDDSEEFYSDFSVHSCIR